MKHLLDTDTCIYAINGRVAGFERHDPQGCCISPIVLGELLYGARKSGNAQHNLEEVMTFVGMISVAPLTEEVSDAYGELRALLEKQGQTIGGNDLWIAAHAKHLDCTLVTNNQREFKRVPGLKLANWIDLR